MKVVEVLEKIKNTANQMEVESEANYLMETFGESIFVEKTEMEKFKSFQSGIRPYAELTFDFIKKEKINLNCFVHHTLPERTLVRLYKDKELQKKVENATSSEKHKINGELFGYPPNAICYFLERINQFKKPGIIKEEVISVRWADSVFVTTLEFLEENLKWMKKEYGSENGRCLVTRTYKEYELFSNEGKHYLPYLSPGELYYSKNYKTIIKSAVSFSINALEINT